jgi:hypothetical protein
MACDYLGEFMETKEKIGASCYTDCFVSGGLHVDKCEFLRLPFREESLWRSVLWSALNYENRKLSTFIHLGKWFWCSTHRCTRLAILNGKTVVWKFRSLKQRNTKLFFRPPEFWTILSLSLTGVFICSSNTTYFPYICCNFAIT